MATNDFLTCDFMKHLKLTDKENFISLNNLYNKNFLTEEDLSEALFIFFHGQVLMNSYLPIDIFINDAMEKFITKHWKIARYEFVSEINDLILKRITFLDRIHENKNSNLVSNIFYDAMFRVLARMDKFNYWLKSIDFTGLSALRTIYEDYEYKSLVQNLIRNSLLDSISSPVYNLALLFSCGIALDNKNFMILYNKSNYLLSDEFKMEYSSYYIKAKECFNYPLFDDFYEIDSKFAFDTSINSNHALYKLLNERSNRFSYKVPDELIGFYLAEELKNETVLN